MDNFTFDEETHTYRLNGEIIPSVTQVLASLNDFSMIRPEVLQHAADRGTAVHRAVELFCADNLEEDSLCDEIKPYFAAFKQFYGEKQPKIISSEQLVCNTRKQYGGKMDLVIEMPDMWLVDIKCTAQVSKTAGIQLVAYRHAYLEMNPVVQHMPKRATLWLQKTGKYQFLVHPEEQADRDWELFKTLLNRIHANTAALAAVEAWKNGG